MPPCSLKATTALLLQIVSESYSYTSHFKALKIISNEFLLTNQSLVQTVVYSEMIIYL